MTGPSTALAILRFPRSPAQAKGRDVVTTPGGVAVMTLDASHRGRQVDIAQPDGAPLGRVLDVGGARWQLIAPGTGQPVAEASLRYGVSLTIGSGPAASIKGHGDEWDLVWERTTLLAARQVPRKVAKHRLDVYVVDPVCTPAVVSFVVHVRRWWAAAESANQQVVQQALTAPPPTYTA